ncbi:succinylglutamate desuccinylase/aspartoacylase family protein [Endozoicomonas sp. SM1973]|uniref:Succinylglutamate desuccinylase/aspartoacylase family protein n=1 Tax=Spartinivicinus marinus TaxID=2994442 RepID=A0A853I378_9GAMM|nr:succinylglutamate desuccinylase/aspartoacylase family protein [Spartinivicinus marinus]MCX4026820.1 succinylglutamate desuccinylase/aspartoacylase family protein [Spartinivicinus marinus]NYZ64654.1 succinylglutamate desuccinylase/aspartoacylase family protein [Spartinivicinus marinus]
MKNKPITISGVTIKPGEQKTIDIPLVAMVTHNNVQMTAHVIHGKSAGPCLFISAAIHGDEINGVEIIRRLLKQKQMQRISGTIIAIPIVNVHGFITHSRYLPDGRDLNRSFPGSSKGSLAARMANTFLKEVVSKCTHGIDLHTGSRHRENLPQIRADLSTDEVKELAHAFGVPAIINSKIRDGSLRATGGDAGIPILLYEAGEALRFNEVCIRGGVKGILNVMRQLRMLPKLKTKEAPKAPVVSDNTSWVRAPSSGILRVLIPLGAKAEKGSVLGVIADPLGVVESKVTALQEGVVIGRANLPLVHEGDALFHLAYYEHKVDAVVNQLENFQEQLEPATPTTAPHKTTDGPII